jgi:hypothetical protein
MSEESFELIEKKHVAGGVVLLRYGSSKDDPLPFILTLMPEHVARETGKPVATIGADDMDAYFFERSRDLMLRALAEKSRGYTTAVLD